MFKQPVPEPGERLYQHDDLAELYGQDLPQGVNSPMDVWGDDAEPNLNRFAPHGKRLIVFAAGVGMVFGTLFLAHRMYPDPVQNTQPPASVPKQR